MLITTNTAECYMAMMVDIVKSDLLEDILIKDIYSGFDHSILEKLMISTYIH